MADASIEPQNLRRQPPPGLVFATTDWDDDVAIGCECADPALQIERWGQDSQVLPPYAS